jgi:hypothetical protein
MIRSFDLGFRVMFHRRETVAIGMAVFGNDLSM